ncbi:MAG: hypothetical protein ACE5E1_05400, partial [Phycisphaerae bacterium]
MRDDRREPAGLDEPNQLAVMVDLHRLRERFPILPVAVGPVFAPLLMEGSMALSATVEGVEGAVGDRREGLSDLSPGP